MSRLLFLSVLFLFLSSCQKEVKFKGKDAATEMVVNAILEVNKPISVSLSETKNILDDSYTYPPINDAIVVLTNSTTNESELLQLQNDGIYTATNLSILENNDYLLEARSNTYSSVSLTSKTPKKTTLNTVKINQTIRKGDNYYQFEISFEDNAVTENYYGIEMTGQQYQYEYDVITQTIDSVLTEETLYFDELEKNSNYTNLGGNLIVLDDGIWNGKTQVITIFVSDWSVIPESEVVVKLYSYSKPLYYYLISYNKQIHSVNDPFSEPVPVFSNASNGLGILGVRTVFEYNVTIP